MLAVSILAIGVKIVEIVEPDGLPHAKPLYPESRPNGTEVKT